LIIVPFDGQKSHFKPLNLLNFLSFYYSRKKIAMSNTHSRIPSKLNKTYWFVAFLVILGGLIFCIYMGLQPKSIPKIKLSSVDKAALFGEAVFQRLRQEINGSRVILLGIMPEFLEQKEFAKGFVNALRSEHSDIMVVSDFRFELKDFLGAEEALNPEVSGSDVANSLQYVFKQNKKALLVVPIVHTSHFIQRNLVNSLRQNSPEGDVLAISVSDFPLNSKQESQTTILCRNEVADPTGYGSLGCMIAGKARSNYYKKTPEKPYIGLMDQVGLNDFLVLFKAK